MNEPPVRHLPDPEKFWKQVDRRGETECWLWTGYKHKGYGVFQEYKKPPWYTHRLAWTFLRGPIPPGMGILHDCPGGDNPACCNPAHLRVGTQKENVEDAVKKGQMPTGDRHGSRTHPETRPRGDAHFARRHPEQMRRGITAGDQRGSKNHCARLDESQVRDIMMRLIQGAAQTTLAEEYGVHKVTINDIALGRTWRHLFPDHDYATTRVYPLTRQGTHK